MVQDNQIMSERKPDTRSQGVGLSIVPIKEPLVEILIT